MNANEYDAWMRSRPKAQTKSDPVSRPIMPGARELLKRTEIDKFEGFRPTTDHRLEPERT